jgi:hypothetical protein
MNVLAVGAMASTPEECEAHCDIPVTGVGVASFDWIDTAMVDYMIDEGVSGGIIGVMVCGEIAYQRGFGWFDQEQTTPMPENALVRLASVSKPVTGAGIQKLVADGHLNLTDTVFGDALGIEPYNGTWGAYEGHGVQEITVQQCLVHDTGWSRDGLDEHGDTVGDYGQKECDAAAALGVPSPPDADQLLEWGIAQPLQYDPNITTDPNPDNLNGYSGFAFLALAKAIEEVSGLGLLVYIRSHVLTPDMWIPWTELRNGKTFKADQTDREAWYCDTAEAESVFPVEVAPGIELLGCFDVDINRPYGSWAQESRRGSGGYIASAAAMLQLAEHYNIDKWHSGFGMALEANRMAGQHGGGLPGTQTTLRQRVDGVNVFVFFNKSKSNGHYAAEFYENHVEPILDATVCDCSGSCWTQDGVDGFWVEPGGTETSVHGSYDMPFAGVAEALDTLGNGSKMNLFAGSDSWTGVIDKKLLLQAPEGSAVIGAN